MSGLGAGLNGSGERGGSVLIRSSISTTILSIYVNPERSGFSRILEIARNLVPLHG